MSDSLPPHGLQHARPPCPSPTPGVYSNYVHWVGDGIQPSHPLSSPSSPAFNLSQNQGLFQWVSSSQQVANILENLVHNKSPMRGWWNIKEDDREVCLWWGIQRRQEDPWETRMGFLWGWAGRVAEVGIGGLYNRNGILQSQGWRPVWRENGGSQKVEVGGYVSVKGNLWDDGGLRPGREEIHVGRGQWLPIRRDGG